MHRDLLGASVMILSFIAFSGAAAADYTITDFPDQSATHSKDNVIEMYCDGDCPVPGSRGSSDTGLTLKIDGCTKLQNYAFSHESGNKYTVEYNIPTEYACGKESHEMHVVDGASEEATATLKVNERNMNSHSGKFLYAGLNTDPDPDSLYYFLLSDKKTADFPTSGWIRVTQLNPKSASSPMKAWSEVYNPVDVSKSNKRSKLILETRSGEQLSSIIDGFNDDCNRTKQSCDVWYADMEKNTDIEFDYPYSDNNRLEQDIEEHHTPLHQAGRYYPNGEVIVAYPRSRYSDGGTNSREDINFYICRSGNEGKVVNTHKNEHGKQVLFRCNSDGSWEKVSECEDGVDNEGGGEIDHPDSDNKPSRTDPDPGCDSPSDNDESDSSEKCKPVIVRESTGVLRAQYGGQPMPGSSADACDGSNGKQTRLADSGIDDVSPVTFTCDETNIDRPFCSTSNRTYGSHDENPSQSGSQITAVKYHPDDEYIIALLNEGENSRDDLSGFNKDMMNRFVDSDGWKPAYMAVDAGYHGVESADLYGDFGTDPHKETYWLDPPGDGGKGMDSPDAGYEDGSYDDSWITANAGSDSQIKTPRFPGGFAGKCGSPSDNNKWELDPEKEEWECSGASGDDWNQYVMAPKITQAPNKSNIGIFVMPFSVRKTSNVGGEGTTLGAGNYSDQYSGLYPTTYWSARYDDSTFDDDEKLNKIEASCWPNENGFTPDFQNSDGSKEGVTHFNLTITEVNNEAERPLPVYGEVKMLDNSSYYCEWKFVEGSGTEVIDRGTLNVINPASTQYNWAAAFTNAYNIEYFGDYGFRDDAEMSHNLFKNTAQQWKGQATDSGSYNYG